MEVGRDSIKRKEKIVTPNKRTRGLDGQTMDDIHAFRGGRGTPSQHTQDLIMGVVVGGSQRNEQLLIKGAGEIVGPTEKEKGEIR